MSIEKSPSKNNRLSQYLDTHISPINFITEYQEKRLPISILIYKVCSTFPLEKLGSHKSAHKSIVNEQFNYLKPLLGEEFDQLIKNKNKYRPKIGQYCEFLFLSFLVTCIKDSKKLVLPSMDSDISEGWDFKYDEIKYDVTTNINKIAKPNIKLVKLNLTNLLDDKNLYLNDFSLSFIRNMEELNISIDIEKATYSNMIINKIRQKYIEISRHKANLRKKFAEQLIVEKYNQDNFDIKIPNIGFDSITEVTSKDIELIKITEEEKVFISSYNKLKPEEKQVILSIINSMTKDYLPK